MRGNVPLQHAIPGGKHQPVLSLSTDADTSNDVLEPGLHVLRGLALVWEGIEIGLERGALPLEGVRGERTRFGGGRVGDRDVIVVHPE